MIPVWNGPIGIQRADIREARSMRQQGLGADLSCAACEGPVWAVPAGQACAAPARKSAFHAVSLGL